MSSAPHLGGAAARPHLPHHWIERQTGRVVCILVSGHPTEDRLPQQSNPRLQTFVASAGIAQHAAREVMQARRLIQVPRKRQTTI